MAGKIAATVAADNIISPLGFTTEENYVAVSQGQSALCRHESLWELPFPVVAALISHDRLDEAFTDACGSTEGYSFFERMAILSVRKALLSCDVDPASSKTLFVIATTKGNVDMLRANAEQLPPERLLASLSARAIARFFGNPNQPIVVSNACISGACALISAARLVRSGRYDNAVVCGVDTLSPFIVSGFHALMATSEDFCRPFDEERTGINLGEAAATIIIKGTREEEMLPGRWLLRSEAVRNDAYHISTPSRNGEGSYRALRHVLAEVDPSQVAFVNVHGTATLFNDEMEARALDRSGLSSVPTNSLKGYFGHTMGAAGVLETAISMHAANDGIVLGTKGFENLGVSKRVNVSAENRKVNGNLFIKTLSGFGGCNAALLFEKWKR